MCYQRYLSLFLCIHWLAPIFTVGSKQHIWIQSFSGRLPNVCDRPQVWMDNSKQSYTAGQGGQGYHWVYGMCGHTGLKWGVTKPISSVPLFSEFSSLVKHMLTIEGHVCIWQVSPQLSCGDTCQIWMWFNEFDNHFCKNFAFREINQRSLSNPRPWSERQGHSGFQIIFYHINLELGASDVIRCMYIDPH